LNTETYWRTSTRYVIVENVAALLGRGLDTVLGDLAALGYDAEWHCIPMKDLFINVYQIDGETVRGRPCVTRSEAVATSAQWARLDPDLRRLYLIRVKPRRQKPKFDDMGRGAEWREQGAEWREIGAGRKRKWRSASPRPHPAPDPGGAERTQPAGSHEGQKRGPDAAASARAPKPRNAPPPWAGSGSA
jgi:hypothetical protein